MLLNKNDIITDYINSNRKRTSVNGCLLCGSYVTGNYNTESDIDLLLLSINHPFEMILEEYKNTLFDRMIVDPLLLKSILISESKISNILSLSFGISQKIIINTKIINEIVSIAKRNIKERKLKYIIDKNKPKKIVDGIPYQIKIIDTNCFLVKNKEIII